jgi:hypothetical protein
MSEEKAPTILQRLYRGALLVFGSVLLIWLAFQVLAQIWGWLLLVAIIGGLIALAVFWVRRHHNRW